MADAHRPSEHHLVGRHGSDDDTPRDRSTRRSGPARLVAAMCLVGILAACGSDGDDTVEIDASIDGTALADAGPSDPIPLSDDESVLEMTLTNVGDEPEEIRYLRLEGEVLGLTFLTYTTSVQVEVAPGESRTITLPLDFFDIESQAHGYLRAQLALYAAGDDRELIGGQDFAVDVRGSVVSTMVLFSVMLVAVTALSLVVNIQGLARRTLPSNRFRRGGQFAVSGLGIGMVLTVAFSMLRIFPLPPTAWWPLLVVPTVAGFAIGYLAPGREDRPDEGDLDDLRELDEVLTDLTE